MEYLAGTQADGVIYVTESHRSTQLKKYGFPIERTFVVGNYPLKSFSFVKRKPKLSESDGQIHCVFEGMLPTKALNPMVSHLYFEPIWLKLAECGVHVHIYSHSVPEYCLSLEKKSPFIHYEGNLRDEALIREISMYDIGLLLYNSPERKDLKTASANKMAEYLSAGLPLVSNVEVFLKDIEKNRCGGKLDVYSDDIIATLSEIRKIKIADDFCETHGMIMDFYADKILEFYKKIISSKCNITDEQKTTQK